MIYENQSYVINKNEIYFNKILLGLLLVGLVARCLDQNIKTVFFVGSFFRSMSPLFKQQLVSVLDCKYTCIYVHIFCDSEAIPRHWSHTETGSGSESATLIHVFVS